MALTPVPPMAFTPVPPMALTPVPPMALTPVPPMALRPVPPMAFTPVPPIALTPVPPMAFTPVPPIALTPVPPMALTPVPPIALMPVPPMALTPVPPIAFTPVPPMALTPVPPMAWGPRLWPIPFVANAALDPNARVAVGSSASAMWRRSSFPLFCLPMSAIPFDSLRLGLKPRQSLDTRDCSYCSSRSLSNMYVATPTLTTSSWLLRASVSLAVSQSSNVSRKC